MINKKFLKWLHRLPVLLLALILAVIPLSMAVPVSANVLDDSESGYYTWTLPDAEWDLRITTSLNYGTFYVVLLPGSYVLITSNAAWFSCNSGSVGTSIHVQATSANPDIIYVSVCEVLGTPPSAGSLWSVDFSDFHTDTYTASEFQGLVFNYPSSFGAVGFNPGILSGGLIDLVYVSPVSITTVFSGVGAWLSGAVQNISTMFWTAESGMSVLGYLAVASLAFAVILLIFYLIAGWLKFH